MPYLEGIEHIHEDPGRFEKFVPANNSLENCMLADKKVLVNKIDGLNYSERAFKPRSH